jgi:D-glycero-D-manno-heptose 1,7-bisphosphate phosphatase
MGVNVNRAAVFLDRDGTVIELVHHLADPEQVRLIDGAVEAIRALQGLDYACVVVTNQSVVGRGKLSEEGLLKVHQRMDQLLHEKGVKLDGLYYCPVAPRQEAADRSAIEHPDRKPGPGMLLRAAREMLLDVGRSWMVGDMLSDTHAGRNAGCRGTVLVRTGAGESAPGDDPSVDFVANNLLEAARIIARHHVSGDSPKRRTHRERTVV